MSDAQLSTACVESRLEMVVLTGETAKDRLTTDEIAWLANNGAVVGTPAAPSMEENNE